jgi:trk system potassium uptake protein TrkH
MRRRRADVVNAADSAKIFAAMLVLLILVGTALLATPWATESGRRTAAVDALFTAVSAASVTGLVTVDTQTHWSLFGEIVILALTQIGGLGFMVGAAIVLQAMRNGQTTLGDAVLLREGGGALSLAEAEQLIGRVVRFTVAVELTGAILLALRFMRDMPVHEALYFGLFHTITAFCNTGFDLFGNFESIARYQTSIWINAVVMATIQAGSLSYLVFSDLASRRRWSRLALDSKLILAVNAVLLAAGAGAFLIAEWGNTLGGMPSWSRPMAALFQSVSARSAGYATVDMSHLHPVTMFIWVGIMLVGGASGSTAGGVKLATIGVIVAAVVSTVRGREDATAFGRRIETRLVYRAMAVVTLMMLAHFAVSAALGITEELLASHDVSFISIMFEAMSALGTVGSSTGITPGLTSAGKVVLCMAMVFGRLGPLTAAYALQRRQARVPYRLPVAPVRIG